MEKLKVTVEDIQRFNILMEVIDRKLQATDAARGQKKGTGLFFGK